jgi:hypothetical protein
MVHPLPEKVTRVACGISITTEDAVKRHMTDAQQYRSGRAEGRQTYLNDRGMDTHQQTVL